MNRHTRFPKPLGEDIAAPGFWDPRTHPQGEQGWPALTVEPRLSPAPESMPASSSCIRGPCAPSPVLLSAQEVALQDLAMERRGSPFQRQESSESGWGGC